MKNLEAAIETLANAATTAAGLGTTSGADTAMKYSQAALNLANAQRALTPAAG